MALKTTYQGASLTSQYLTIHFRSDVGTAVRFCSVKIPIEDLRAEVFHDAMNLMASRVLARHDAIVNRETPLF